MYTRDEFYSNVNKYLRDLRFDKNSTSADQQWKVDYANCLTKALDKLPNFIGTVYRGVARFQHSKQITGNPKVLNWKSFNSTSTNEATAVDFSDGAGGTVYHIDSLTGKDIAKFSAYEHEAEILLSPFTYFMVDKVVPGTPEHVYVR